MTVQLIEIVQYVRISDTNKETDLRSMGARPGGCNLRTSALWYFEQAISLEYRARSTHFLFGISVFTLLSLSRRRLEVETSLLTSYLLPPPPHLFLPPPPANIPSNENM